MIKKLLYITMMFMITLIFINISAHAATVLISEPASNTGGTWHVEDGNRVYIHMRYTDDSTVIETGEHTDILYYPDYDFSNMTPLVYGSENDISFPNLSNEKKSIITNPDDEVYDKFVIEIIDHLYPTGSEVISGDFPAPGVIDSFEYNTAITNVEVRLNDWSDRPLTNYLYDYSYLEFYVDGISVFSNRNVSEAVEDAIGLPENPYFYPFYKGVRMYFEKSETTDPIDPGSDANPWESLPETTGSPSRTLGDWGEVSDVSYTSNTVSFDIEYLGTTYPVSSFNVDGDLDFIDKANDILYYTDLVTDDRILYFNFGDTLDSAILASQTFNNVNVWKGEALWNLTQNEIKVTDVRTVYNYIPEIDDDGNVYSYFYMPDVPIDNLLSVTSVLAYRYWDDGFLGFGDAKPGDIQYKTVTATKGISSSTNPTWVEETYQNMYLTAAVTSIATIAGIIPGYGWAISGAFLLAGGLLNVADVNEWFAYDIEQIQHVIPNSTLINEINSYIIEESGNTSFNPSTDKLYKLHLASLTDGDAVQVMGEYSNVTQVVWETDGEIYLLSDDNIDNAPWAGPGTLIPPDNGFSLPDNWYIYAIFAIGAYIVFKEAKLSKKPGLVIIILLVAYYLLNNLGII